MTLHQHKPKTHYTYSPSPSELHHVVLDVRALSHVLNVHDLKVFRGDIVLIKNSLKYLILISIQWSPEYSGDWNKELVWYSNGPNLSDCCMVRYSDHKLSDYWLEYQTKNVLFKLWPENRLLLSIWIAQKVKVCYSDVSDYFEENKRVFNYCQISVLFLYKGATLVNNRAHGHYTLVGSPAWGPVLNP